MAAAQPAARTRIIAHRGASRVAPENTLAAFRAAIAGGAEGIELDVQFSRDGVPMVMHDTHVDRTTNGHGWVRDLSAAELGALDAGCRFDPPLAGQTVPTLAAVLALLAPSSVVLHVELKTAQLDYPGLVPAVLDVVRAAGAAERVVLSSFNHHSLREARRLEPRIPCAALLSNVLIEPWDYARRQGFQALHARHEMVDAIFVGGCRSAGLGVRAWTVDDATDAVRLFALGVDGLITNDLDAMLRLRDREQGT